MKVLLCFSFLYIIDTRIENNKESIQIQDTDFVIRFYPKAKKNIEILNDTLSLSIYKKNETYHLGLIKNGKIITACNYRYKGKIINRTTIKRNTTEKEGPFSNEMQKIKIIEPINFNCIANTLKGS